MMGCEYCDGKGRKKILDGEYGDPTAYILKSIRGDRYLLYIGNEYSFGDTGTKINYCPMCGRRLEDV